MKRTLHLYSSIALFFFFNVIHAQYVYYPNDLELIADLQVKEEKIRYSERTGDTSVFETNTYNIHGNIIEYKSKDNMPIQAKLVYHYDADQNCSRVDYYRNHILYQYKETIRSKKRISEKYYSVTGKYKGLQEMIYLDDDGREEKIIIKRKGHPKLTKKFFYHDNGKLKQIHIRKGKESIVKNYDLNGEPILKEKKIEKPVEIVDYYANGNTRSEKRQYVAKDLVPEHIVKIGKGVKDEYQMEMITHKLVNGLNDKTEIFIEGKLMYVYLFEYTYHGHPGDSLKKGEQL